MREVGWRSVALKDTGIWLSGGTPFTGEPRFWDGRIPWISAASLKEFIISRSDRCVTELGARSGTRMIPPGTVLFVVRGMSLKNEFRVGVTERPVAFGQDCKAILPASDIDGKFLAFALKARAHEILAMVDEAGHGTGRLPTDLIERLCVGIPNFNEQQRIVEALDSLEKQIEVSLVLMAKLRQVRLASLRQLAVRGSWQLAPLGTLLVGIDAGNSPNLEDTPAEAGQWGVLKVSAVGGDGFHPEENKVAEDHSLHNAALCVRPGDLLMTRANTSQLVGLACVVDNAPHGLMLCDKTLRLRVDERLVPTKYVQIMLGMAEVRRQIESLATGTSASMKNISQQSIKKLMIPVGGSEDIAQVVQIHALHEERESALRYEVERLRMLKQGLMGDLLSGRVRVPSI